MIGVANLHVVVGLDIGRGHGAGAFGHQRQLGLVLTGHGQSHALQVEQYFDDVFLGTFNRRVLVLDAVNLDFGDGAAGHR